MSFRLDQVRETLARTPAVLDALLGGLPEERVRCDEGPGTWSAYDVVGHLIHGERTDWIPRAERILEHGTSLAFEPFDRFAQLREDQGAPLEELLLRFGALRQASLARLADLAPTAEDLEREGLHPDPALGRVRLRELLATWAVHDLVHLAQIARVLARREAPEVGPWRAYLPLLQSPAP